jgi:pyrroloquinoline quinone biosynthesis protein D
MPVIADDARPRLKRGVRLHHDQTRGEWTLLAPERIFQADAVAVEVLRRCTGETTLRAIVDELAEVYAAPRERIEADVQALLRSLAEKRLLDV